MKRFKADDNVWAMRSDKPQKLMVLAVIECNDVLFYQLVQPSHWVGGMNAPVKSYGRLPGTRRDAADVYATKKELLDSFL